MGTGDDAVLVRRLERDESADYRALRLECLRLHPAFFGSTHAEALAAELPFERHIRARDPDHAMFGAFDGGQLRGLCGFQREPRLRARHRGELVQMYVAPELTRRGVGSRLIAAVVRFAFDDPTISQVVLSVVAQNAAAIAAYRRAGFREYGRLENYFSPIDGVDATQLFMVRERR